MSQLLQGLDSPIVVANLAPTHHKGGLPFTATGALAIDEGAPVDYYNQGLPFSIGGRICTSLNGVVDKVSPGGAPFTATGLLAIGNSGSDHVSCGVAYTAANQISTA